MFGLLFTLKTFVNQITPRILDDQEKEPIRSFQTSQYQLHYFETASGLRFAASTSPNTSRVQSYLERFYRLYVDYVLKNPIYKRGDPITLPGFVQRIDACVKEMSH
mmetsp:Transcript_28810/g.53959  ORF Transcript_28810/g.53959 Transcript_28810/m.53959 type:complete len:106 (-) Transcript_28810:267-584(-)